MATPTWRTMPSDLARAHGLDELRASRAVGRGLDATNMGGVSARRGYRQHNIPTRHCGLTATAKVFAQISGPEISQNPAQPSKSGRRSAEAIVFSGSVRPAAGAAPHNSLPAPAWRHWGGVAPRQVICQLPSGWRQAVPQACREPSVRAALAGAPAMRRGTDPRTPSALPFRRRRPRRTPPPCAGVGAPCRSASGRGTRYGPAPCARARSRGQAPWGRRAAPHRRRPGPVSARLSVDGGGVYPAIRSTPPWTAPAERARWRAARAYDVTDIVCRL